MALLHINLHLVELFQALHALIALAFGQFRWIRPIQYCLRMLKEKIRPRYFLISLVFFAPHGQVLNRSFLSFENALQADLSQIGWLRRCIYLANAVALSGPTLGPDTPAVTRRSKIDWTLLVLSREN